MSIAAILVFATVAAGQPAMASAATPTPVEVAEADRTPVRCKPAPYYVADRGERSGIERVLVTGSRVPLTARDYPDRRARPCFLMREPQANPNPLRTAD
jgi:hypothetical protein